MFEKWTLRSTELKMAVLAVCVFVVLWVSYILVQKILSNEEDLKPCGTKSPQGQCYNLTPEACLAAWNHYEEGCWQEAKANVQSPSQLLGSAVNKCAIKKFHLYMGYNLKNQDDEICKSYFQKAKE